MRRVLRFGQVAILVAFFTGILAVSEIRAQGPLGQILNRMDTHYKALSSLQADLTMVKADPNLGAGGVDTVSGNINYLPKTAKRPMYVRLNWTKPSEEWMVVIGETFMTFRPRINEGYTGKADKTTKNNKAGGALAFISMSKEQLKANYDILFVAQEQISGGTETWHLQLTPKTPQSYKLAEMWVDGDGMPRQFKVTEKNNDTSTFLLTNLKKNLTINGNIFHLDIPKGAKMSKV